ncbi:MAG: hypothetical protein ABI266_08490 [Ginsengibacter sp.]
MHIKLEGKALQEYVVFDNINDIEYVYKKFKKRVISKNGAGRVDYFDLVMIATESLLHEVGRKEVFNQENNFGLNDTVIIQAKKKKEKRGYEATTTLGERIKPNALK